MRECARRVPSTAQERVGQHRRPGPAARPLQGAPRAHALPAGKGRRGRWGRSRVAAVHDPAALRVYATLSTPALAGSGLATGIDDEQGERRRVLRVAGRRQLGQSEQQRRRTDKPRHRHKSKPLATRSGPRSMPLDRLLGVPGGLRKLSRSKPLLQARHLEHLVVQHRSVRPFVCWRSRAIRRAARRPAAAAASCGAAPPARKR
jgi:hypothetical protein